MPKGKSGIERNRLSGMSNYCIGPSLRAGRSHLVWAYTLIMDHGNFNFRIFTLFQFISQFRYMLKGNIAFVSDPRPAARY